MIDREASGWLLTLLLVAAAGSLHAGDADGSRYRRARQLEQQHRLRSALELYDALEPDRLPDAVGRDVAVRRATLLARTGRCAEARARLAKLAERVGGHRGAVLQAMAAECALAAGDPKAAEAALDPVIERDARYVDTFAAWLGLAEARARRGDRDGARRSLQALWVARPEHPDIEMVEAQLRALGPDPIEATDEERMDRAERLTRFREHDRALAELDRAGRPRERQARRRWLHLRGMALYRTRHRYDEAAPVLERAARLGGSTEVADAFHAARAWSRAGKTPRALRGYRRLVRRFPKDPHAARAEYLAAWLDMTRGRPVGRARMRRFLEGSRSARQPKLARNARWHLAFEDFEHERYTAAAEGFAAYAETGRGALVRARGLYWRGRALQEAGDRAAAEEAYRAAADVQALHYYALLARGRLAELGSKPDPLPPLASREQAPVDVRLPEASQFYARLGFIDDAITALRAAEDEVEKQAPEGRGLEAVVTAYRKLGSPQGAYRRVATTRHEDLERLPTAETRWVWDAAYPRPWHEAAAAAARVHRVPPALVHAVMRQESAYDPEAVSYAGAVGLMQLMPATARGLAPEAGRTRLFDPAFNVRLGAQLLGQLLSQFEGSEPLAAAAYNAGGHRVRRWLEGAAPGQLDQRVERIPIQQTRNYVRRVMSHYVRYQYLAGETDPGFQLGLP